ncbi:MAG: TetR/AcrR family transcriptional regulator [Defluviitaleaceae bacterium]|nr:TetR/AcrR family transcriptional regulator [Defluviitaleaceae bacterium]
MNDKNETSKKIMDMALELFSKQGYSGTTTKEIARDAGVNELTLFRHFGSKLNLFQEIMEYYAMDPEVDDVFQALEDMCFADQMMLISTRIYQLYLKNMKLYKVQMKLTDNAKDVVKLKLSRKLIVVLEVHFTALKNAQQIQGDPHLMAVTLINSLLGILTVSILGQNTITEKNWELLVKEHAKQFVALYEW